MKTTALLTLILTLAAGARAADLNGICAADVKTGFAAETPAVPAARPAAAQSQSVCEAAMAKSLDFRPVAFQDGKGRQLRGFENAYYTEYGPMAVSLVLQTADEAYYYYEDCDICASIDKCDLRTGAVSRVVSAHSADCSDLPSVEGAVYSACAKKPADGLKACEASLAKSLDFRPVAFRDAAGQPLRGFENGYYSESGSMRVPLVLLTDKAAYYYHEDCDICAALEKCDLATGRVTNAVTAHSVDCSDLAGFSAGASYNACAGR